MKNNLKTGIYIMAFALAGIFFQISCSNSNDSTDLTTTVNEKIVYVKKDFPNTGEQSIWTVNLDGTNQTQIPITLPSNVKFYSVYGTAEHSTARLSQDGQVVLFTIQKTGAGGTSIYSCNIDGTNLQEGVALGSGVGVFL